MAISDNINKLTQLIELIENLPEVGSGTPGGSTPVNGIIDVRIEEVTNNG